MISFETSILMVALAVVAVIVGALLFSRVLRRAEGFSPNDRIAAWEVFAKVVTTCAAIIAGLLAFVRYIDQRELELAASSYEAAQKVREVNISIYAQSTFPDHGRRVLLNEATDLVSTLATLDDLRSPTGVISTDRFERLYHGQLVLYEGPSVSEAMIDFRDAIIKWQKTGTRPTKLLPDERSNTKKLFELSKTNSDFMRQLALRLSKACQEELRELDETARDGNWQK